MRSTSSGSHGTVFRRLDVRAVIKRLAGGAREALRARPAGARGARIGARAQGTWAAASAADVVVVVDAAPDPGPLLGREARYRPSPPLGIGLDVFVRTAAELADMGERFGGEVAAGTVLWER